LDRTAVVYLLRKVNDPRVAHAFFDGLLRFPAGAPYCLVLLYKGFADGEIDPVHAAFAPRLPCAIEVLRYPDELSATEVLVDAGSRIDCDRFLFFTSWARLRGADWLKHYLGAFASVPNCGIVGATGAFERLNDTTPFPNINIRTNGFMVERDVFASLDPGDLKAELGGNLFEAGPASMTRQILARGLAAVVVDRHGRVWHPPDWPASLTFRAGEQQNLLVADNRTMHYSTGSIRKRRRLARRAWGSEDGVARRIWPLRQIDAWKWRYPRGISDVARDLRAWAQGLLRR